MYVDARMWMSRVSPRVFFCLRVSVCLAGEGAYVFMRAFGCGRTRACVCIVMPYNRVAIDEQRKAGAAASRHNQRRWCFACSTHHGPEGVG